ncbi:MAG: hypothetical protein FJ096_16790 [Deltaproteobacteria bacterium]|nr:hypothetical protein [Deltaproteobacteria bacterium]
MIRKVLFGTYVAALLAAGCSTQPLPQDMCSWIADENSCLQRFAVDVGEVCGNPFSAGSDPTASATGYFATRDKLDICVKSAGGQVVFDPPLDLSTFPLEQVAFKLLDDQALPCGSGSYASEHSFSVTIEERTTDDPADPITGGTFSITASADTKNTYEVSCPGGVEKHTFNALLLNKCPSRIPFQPTAVLESSPGVPETDNAAARPGFVRFRVEYPPKDVDVAGATPDVVEYFSCVIPAPPPPCQDGVRNGTETAIDCGGNCAAKGFRCAEGQACINNDDCQSSKCVLTNGIKQCAAS